MGGYAWVTLATNDAYSLGALVLAHSLRRVGTKYELAVLVTPGVTEMMREKLAAVFSLVQEVNVLDSKDEANLALLARPELGITFTKLHCWRLTQYDKCVFVDADTLVVRNCDELFEHEELSAAPDVGWPDCFNSGVFVFRPSMQTFASITAFAAAKGSFDGGDQGLLNLYFSDWARKDISKHLPFIYNMCSTAMYSYLPAYKQFGEDVRIIHFIGITKPWLQYFDTLTGIVQPPSESVHLQPLLQLWWNIFCEKVHPQLSPVMAGLAGALAQMTLGEPRSAEQIALEEHMRKQSWEHGQIDYMGRDSFDNIWKKICETLALAPQRLPSPPKETPEPKETSSIDEIDTPVKEEVEKEIVQATIAPIEEQCLIKDLPTDKIPEQQKHPAEDTISVPEKENIERNVPEEKAQTVGTTTTSTDKDIKEAPIATELEQFSVQKVLEQSSQQSESKLQCEITAQPSSALSITQTCTEMSAEEVPVGSLAEEVPKQTVVLAPACPIKQSIDISKVSLEIVPDSGIEAESTKPPVQSDTAIESSNVSTIAQQAITQMEKAVDASTKSDISHPKVDTVTTVPASEDTSVCATGTQPDEMIKKSNIGGEQHAEILSAASEVLTVSPVPIQVAESVLQAEPQELISDESQVRTQEVLSSTVTPVHEFTATSSETITNAPSQIQLNGTASDITPMEKIEEARTIATDIVSGTVPKATETIEKLIELTTTQAETSQPLPIVSSTPKDEEEPKVPTESSSASSGALVEAKKAEEIKCLPESIKSAQPMEAIKDIERPAELKQSPEEVKTPPAQVELVQPAECIKSLEKSEEVKQLLKEVVSMAKPTDSVQLPEEIKGLEKPVEPVQPVEVVQPLQQPAELSQPPKAVEHMEKPAELVEQIEEIKIAKEPAKPAEQIEEIETAQKSTELTQQPVEVEHVKEVEQPTADVQKSDTPPPSPSTESPIRPIRTKDLNIPGTPIVTEATPPTSPPITTSQELEAQEKATKKTVKKAAEKSMPESDSAEAGEADAGEKKVKKVVKKVVKKPKSKPEDAPEDGADGSSGPSKQKKTVKVVKKGTKPSQTLGAEVPVPETPPPGTSDAPVPPKRKGKTTTTKPVAAKKSDVE